MLKFSKKVVRDFDVGLPEKVIAKIPNVNDDVELCSIGEKIHSFETKLIEIRLKFDEVRNYPSSEPHVPLPGVEADAEQILGGTPIDSLSGPATNDAKRDVLRQINALERAVLILQNQRRHRIKVAIQLACQSLPSEVTQIFRDILIAGEQLEAAIKRGLKIDQVLSQKGIESTMRDPRFQVLPFWKFLIFGGSQPAMGFIIENQKKAWDEVEGK